MPDKANAKDKSGDVTTSVTETQSGSIASSRAADVNRDPMGELLKQQFRTPLVATVGKFPNGRSVPSTANAKALKAESKRQDLELEIALTQVQQLKSQLLELLNVPNTPETQESLSKAESNYINQYGYGEGTGSVDDDNVTTKA